MTFAARSHRSQQTVRAALDVQVAMARVLALSQYARRLILQVRPDGTFGCEGSDPTPSTAFGDGGTYLDIEALLVENGQSTTYDAPNRYVLSPGPEAGIGWWVRWVTDPNSGLVTEGNPVDTWLPMTWEGLSWGAVRESEFVFGQLQLSANGGASVTHAFSTELNFN